MKTRIISNEEIKVLIGISGSGQDALIEMWNDIATETLCDLMKVDDLGVRTITNERAPVLNQKTIVLKQYPVDLTQTITALDFLRDTVPDLYYIQDPGDKRTLKIVDQDSVSKPVGYEELFMSYTAGYTVKGTIEVLDFASLVGKTMTSYTNGAATNYTFVAGAPGDNEIQASNDDTTTLTNIQTALGGDIVGDVLSLPLGVKVQFGVNVTDLIATYVSPTIPQPLKMAVALLVGGGVATRSKKGGVSSYKVGTKSVTFASGAEANMFKNILSQYAANYKTLTIGAI